MNKRKRHRLLDIRVARMGIHNKNYAVLSKVMIDQLIITPPYLAFYITVNTMLEKNRIQMSDISNKLTKNYYNLLISCYQIWPIAHLITFSLPFKYRTVFCDIVRFYWGMRMSQYGNDATFQTPN